MARSNSNRPGWELVRETWREHGGNLKPIFLQLNWGNPTAQEIKVSSGSAAEISVKPVASLKNFHAFEISLPTDTPTATIRQVQKEVSKIYPDSVLVFKDSQFARFEWPRRKPDGGIKYDNFTTKISEPLQLTCQKLAGVSFTLSEINSATLEDVRSRVYGLASEGVTKRFYERFRDEHENLAKAISSSTDLSDPERHSYASLLLNRLMFVYFLQKKEFLSNNPHLLNEALVECTATSTNFYRDALLPLFFEGFNGQQEKFSSVHLDGLWGKIPYINGGIFAPHGLEIEVTAEITIPNKIFADVFEFFELFDWHLDARPLGTPNEINPEVLGYIFEQYINFTADGKKDNGAYYTPEDVTGYMVAQTIVSRILDELLEVWPNSLVHLQNHSHQYLHRSMLHGARVDGSVAWEAVPEEIETIWAGDPANWGSLDEAPTDINLCLAGESWVEALHRRDRTEKLIEKLQNGDVKTVNDLVTLNLNGSQLISDILAQATSISEIEDTWRRISKLSIIDPTCGSGAFLYAAMNCLESVYDEIASAAERLDHSIELFARGGKGNSLYLIRKHIAMSNLYGTDIMADAVETAKLRIFLALAAVLNNADEIEPLPDLDFNIKSGNLIVGLFDYSDRSRVEKSDQLSIYDFSEIEELLPAFQAKFNEFKRAELVNVSSVPEIKRELSKIQERLRDVTNKKYAEIASIESAGYKTWLERMKPFHWFIEFPEIIEQGGFDVVIGNPPYIEMSKLDDLTRAETSTYRCAKSLDFFAICQERSYQLLSNQGRHSFIVKISLAAGAKFENLREVVSGEGKCEWWSTFGKRPNALFSGIQVVNTILTLAPGHGAHATRHHLFTPKSRLNLFEQIEYFEIERAGAEKPIRGGLGTGICEAIASLPALAVPQTFSRIYMRGRARYWFPVLPEKLPEIDASGNLVTQDDSLLGHIDLPISIRDDLAIALLAGKIGYLWWSSTGDDFNCYSSQGAEVVRLLYTFSPSPALVDLAKKTRDVAYDLMFGSANAGKIQLNVRWKNARRVTDKFDQKFLEECGLGKHWVGLNIWYRQAMRAERDNTNAVVYSRNDIQQILSKVDAKSSVD